LRAHNGDDTQGVNHRVLRYGEADPVDHGVLLEALQYDGPRAKVPKFGNLLRLAEYCCAGRNVGLEALIKHLGFEGVT
jgi:hypothetical protein